MKQKAEKMIKFLFPDAVPGKDFEIQILPNKTAVITRWDAVKLGANPGIEKLHSIYMTKVKQRKAVLPTFDDTDPLPYLSAEKVRRASPPVKPVTEIFNGVAFTKVN